jgi:tRNA (guanine-N7-)-methyltransferase
MHALHARLPKNFVLEERLERYADAIEASPADYAGTWAEACHPLVPGHPHARYRRVVLDMGCGKGASTVEAASRDRDTLYVGIDCEPICIAYAAQHAVEAQLRNVVFAPGVASKLERYFAPGELDQVILNFPTPFPRKKEAWERLTHADVLVSYRRLLRPGGVVTFKTDSLPLWNFSRGQFEIAGYSTLWESTDARAERPQDPVSWYEKRLSAQGATVYAIEATPDPAREPKLDADGRVVQTKPLSLIDYLPDDLESMDYIPHGMQGTVINLRNLARKGHFDRHL